MSEKLNFLFQKEQLEKSCLIYVKKHCFVSVLNILFNT